MHIMTRGRRSEADAVCADEDNTAIDVMYGRGPLGLRFTTWIFIIIFGLTLLKLLVASVTPIAFDEALYWRYSKHLAPGFMDHPFMNPLMIRLGTTLFGDTPLGVRFMGVILSFPASWAVWRATLSLFRRPAMAATAALFFNFTVVMSIGPIFATSDEIVVVTSCFLIAGLAELQRSGRGAWWLAIGVAFGLGMCSKYTTIFFAVSILAWLAIVPAQRRWLISPWTWAGGVIALAVFAPVLVWNSQHQWASFVYQSGRLTVYKWTARYIAEFIAALVILATPPIFILSCIGLRPPRPGQADVSARVLLLALVAPLVLYLLWHATHERVQGNWPEPVYPAMAIAAAYAAHTSTKGRKALALTVRWSCRTAPYFGLGLAALVYLEASTGFLPLGHHDPRARVLGVGWKDLGAQIDALRARAGAKVILTTDYTLASWTRFYLPSSTPIEQINDRMRWSNEPAPDARLFQGTALYICKNACSKLPALQARFRSVQLLAVLQPNAPGRTDIHYRVYQLKDQVGRLLDPPSLINGADHAD
jgi:4-amino-4-deoxy-L-arabinose transferase-like glycosyltransferase